MPNAITWTNTTVKLGDLKPWADNPKLSTKAQAKRILDSWQKFGQVMTVAIGPSNEVYDGHQRLSVLLTLYGPEYTVDARQSSRHLTDDEHRAMVLALTNATGSWNWEQLAGWQAEELKGWGFDKDTLKGWKSDVTALNSFLDSEKPAKDAPADVDRAAELLEKWQVQTGDMFAIGAHLLICGDCTDAATVARVMGGERAKLVMADPPYNVKYTGGSTNENERADSYEDDMTDEQYTEWLIALWKNGFDNSDDKAPLLLWFASAKMRCIMDGFEGAGWEARTLIVWNKLKAHYGALGAQYKHKYEPMWYCFKRGKSPRFFGASNETTVWDFDQPRVNELHPTMKPIELYQRCVQNHSEANDEVLELFSGSGTTLVACENLKRRCRAIEISPAYVAVALERMSSAFPELKIEKV